MNLQTACNLTEGKSFGGRRTFANEKAILMSTLVRLIGSLRTNLDKKMIARAVSDYDGLKEEFKDALFGILGSFQKGKITAEVMETLWHSEIKDAWEKAYGLGVKSVGNPFGIWKQDKTWLKGAEAEEFGYLGKFVEDIKQNALIMGIEDRLSMYAETLDGVFHHGQVEGSPEFVKIIWHLRDAKHCDDCIRLAAGSPYTKRTLPTVPKSGDSRCLSNCRCFLEYRYADGKPAPETYVIKGPKLVVPPQGYRLPSDSERDKLGQMSSEIDRLRGMISATSGGQKKELIGMRRDLNSDMIDFMEKHKIYYVPGGQMQKVKFVESIVDEVKKELLLEGGPGSGFFGHKGRPGKRGGSLSGGAVSPHGVGSWVVKRNVHISASPNEKLKLYKTLKSVPESHLKRSGVKTITVMNNLKEVNELYFLRSGDKGPKNFKCDAFYDHNTGEMVLSPGSSPATILHEFAHSIPGAGMWKKKVWDGNASTGSVSRYGKTNMDEGFSEAYAHHVLVKDSLKGRAPAVSKAMEEFFKK